MEIESFLIEAHIFRRSEEGLRFLLMKRSAGEIYPNIWQMVTGKIKQGENAYITAAREILEETGLAPIRFWVVPTVNSFYDHTSEKICLVPVFAAEVENAKVTISREHSEFKWTDREEAKILLAWKGQREAVDLIEEYFAEPKSELKFIELTSLLK